MWASDFPHSDAKYPGVVDELREYTEGMDPDARAGCSAATRATMYALMTRRTVVSVDLDLLVRGGTVVDGTGAPARTADVAVADGRIVEIGRLDDATRREVDRRRRAARDARLRRRAHALRRAAALGSDRVARVVARRHDAVHRQLRLHARAEPARRRRVAAAHAAAASRACGRRARGRRRRSAAARSATSSPVSTAASA